MAVPTTLHIGRPCMLCAPSRRRGLGGAGSPTCRGWGGEGGGGRVGEGGREGGALHCTMCALPHCIVLCTALHCVCCAALHGARCTARCCAMLYTALRVLCYTARCGAPLCFVCDVLCCTAPCVLRCSVQRVAPRTAHVCCAPACCAAQHCACGTALPRLRLVRASRGGRGTRDRQLASVVACARTPGRERDT